MCGVEMGNFFAKNERTILNLAEKNRQRKLRVQSSWKGARYCQRCEPEVRCGRSECGAPPMTRVGRELGAGHFGGAATHSAAVPAAEPQTPL